MPQVDNTIGMPTPRPDQAPGKNPPRRRYFQRPGDGVVFEHHTPEHIVRLLTEGWREVPTAEVDLALYPPPPKPLTAEEIAAIAYQGAMEGAGVPPPAVQVNPAQATIVDPTLPPLPTAEELAEFRAYREAQAARLPVADAVRPVEPDPDAGQAGGAGRKR